MSIHLSTETFTIESRYVFDTTCLVEVGPSSHRAYSLVGKSAINQSHRFKTALEWSRRYQMGYSLTKNWYPEYIKASYT